MVDGRYRMCKIEDFHNLRLIPDYAKTVREELDTWHRCYLGVKGTAFGY